MEITDENKKLFDKYIKGFVKVKNGDNPNACQGCYFTNDNPKDDCNLIAKFFTDSDDAYQERFQLGCSIRQHEDDNIDYIYKFNLADRLRKL